MAQYKDFNGANFGNGVGSSTTFEVINSGSNTGNIYLSGSGGYVNSPTGITKAELDAGINLKFDNDLICQALVCVENGACSGSCEEANWCVTPTPTPSPVTSYQFNITPGSGEAGESSRSTACFSIAGDSVYFALSREPLDNDIAYTDASLTTRFDGDGSNFYGIDTNSDGAPEATYVISSNGVLSSKVSCTS
jgi:hypothetical protein